MDIHPDVVATVGNTPLIRLSRIHPPGNLVAKLESTNPGGSVKERIAIAMIDAAEKSGHLRPGGTIVEPTSGNTGVGLAMIGAVRGYRVICTVPDKVSKEKQDLLKAYGAEVVVTPTDLLPEHPESYYGVARRLASEIDGAFHPDQYSNPANPEAHYRTTGPEIWEQTGGAVDVSRDRGRHRRHHLRGEPLPEGTESSDARGWRRPRRVDLHRGRQFRGAPVRRWKESARTSTPRLSTSI